MYKENGSRWDQSTYSCHLILFKSSRQVLVKRAMFRSISLPCLDNYENQSRESLGLAKVKSISRVASTASLGSSNENLKLIPNSTFIQLLPGLYLALYDKKHARLVADHELTKPYALATVPRIEELQPMANKALLSSPACLEVIFRFDQACNTLHRKNAGGTIVIYTGSSLSDQSRIIFLIGSHLLMTHHFSPEHVRNAFHQIKDKLKCDECEFAMPYYWNALGIAKSRKWVCFKETFDCPTYTSGSIDMDEYLHYAR